MADGKVTIDSELNDKGLEKGLKNLQGKLEGAGSKLQSVGGSLTKNLTLPIVAAGTGALLMAKNFDDSMRKVKATMGDSLGKTTAEAEANFKKLREEAILLGATTAFSASDAASAMEELALKGWDTNQILAATNDILNLASASGMDLGAAANLVSGQMAAFGLEAEKAGWASDMFQTTASSSGTTVEALGNALEMAGGNAAAAGMDLIQTNAILGAFANTNITGSKAGTTFNAMLSDLKSSAKDGTIDFGEFQVQLYDTNGEMKDMGSVLVEMEKEMEGMTTAQKDAAMAAVFGEQSQRGVNSILAQGTDVVMDLEEAMRNGEGAAKAAAEEMEGGIGGAMRGLASATESLAISFGDILAPHIQKAAEFLSDLALKFSKLSEETKKKIVVVGAILAALGPFLTILGTIIIFVSKVVGVLASINPVVLIVIGVIAALVAIGIQLYKNWDTIKEKAIEVFSKFKPLLDTVKDAFQKLKDSIQPIMESLKTLWESLIPILEKVGAIVGAVVAVAFGILIGVFNGVVAAIGPIINALINFVDFVVNMVNVIVALFTGDFAGAWEFLGDAAQSSIDFFVNLFEGLVNFVMGFVDAIVGFFHGLYMTLVGNSIIPDLVNEIVQWFKDMFQWVIDIVMNIVDGIVDGFMFIYETVSNYIEMVLEIVKSVWQFIQDVFTNALAFLKALVSGDFEGMRDAIKNIMDSAKRLLENIWQAIDKFLSKTLGGIWDTVKNIFGNIFSTISNILGNIRSTISNIFSAIRTVISNILNSIRSTIVNIWTGIKNTVTNVVTGIKNTITNIFNSLKGIVTSAFSKVKNAVKTGITGAYNAVTDKIKDFFNAGKNIVGSIADGIKAAVGKVTDAIGNVVSKVRDFLPFSPAKTGPLTDIDKLNFDGPIGDSIEDAIPDVQAKMNAMLEVPNLNPVMPGGVAAKQVDSQSGQMAELIKAVERLASRPASFQIDDIELVRAISDTMDTDLANRLALENYLNGGR